MGAAVEALLWCLMTIVIFILFGFVGYMLCVVHDIIIGFFFDRRDK